MEIDSQSPTSLLIRIGVNQTFSHLADALIQTQLTSAAQVRM